MLLRAISMFGTGLASSVCLVCVYASTYIGGDINKEPDFEGWLIEDVRLDSQDAPGSVYLIHTGEAPRARTTLSADDSDVKIEETLNDHLTGEDVASLFTGKGSYSSLTLMRQDGTGNNPVTGEASSARVTLIGLGGLLYLVWLVAAELARKRQNKKD